MARNGHLLAINIINISYKYYELSAAFDSIFKQNDSIFKIGVHMICHWTCVNV